MPASDLPRWPMSTFALVGCRNTATMLLIFVIRIIIIFTFTIIVQNVKQLVRMSWCWTGSCHWSTSSADLSPNLEPSIHVLLVTHGNGHSLSLSWYKAGTVPQCLDIAMEHGQNQLPLLITLWLTTERQQTTQPMQPAKCSHAWTMPASQLWRRKSRFGCFTRSPLVQLSMSRKVMITSPNVYNNLHPNLPEGRRRQTGMKCYRTWSVTCTFVTFGVSTGRHHTCSIGDTTGTGRTRQVWQVEGIQQMLLLLFCNIKPSHFSLVVSSITSSAMT